MTRGQPAPPTPAAYGAMVERRDQGLGRPPDLRARPDDRRQCRRAADPGDPGEAGRNPIPFVIVDAAMNDLMRPALYDAYHEIEPVAPDAASE